MIESTLTVRLNIVELAQSRGVDNPYQLFLKIGGSKGTAWHLWRGEVMRVEMDTIATLCEVLSCKPGDLFVVERSTPRPTMLKNKKG